MSDRIAKNPADVFPIFHPVGRQEPQRGAERLTVLERGAHRGVAAGVILSRTLWHSDEFRSRATIVRGSVDQRAAAWERAGAYAAGESAGRRVIAGLLFTAGSVELARAETILELMWLKPIVREDQAAKNHPRVTANTLRVAKRGSELIARRGAGRCLVAGCPEPITTRTVNRGDQSYQSSGPVYCQAHDREPWRQKADSKAIEHAFTAAAAAWPNLEDRELLRWWWAQRARHSLQA